MASRPTRWTAATPCTSYSSATRRRPAQRVERGRVGGVLQPAYAVPVVVVADPADEERQPARGLVVERGDHLGDVQRGLAEVDEPHDAGSGAGTW